MYMSGKNFFYIALVLAYILMLSACSKKQADEIQAVDPAKPTPQVTYTGFVGPLFQTRCAGCHGPGRQSAPIFTFDGYASVTANAARIRNAVLVQKSMPIGTALSAAELQSLRAWFDAGLPF
jgi:mono/diheme cytochrome c family protein